MAEMSPGAAVRQLQQVQATMKKVRQALRLAKGDPESLQRVAVVGWTTLAAAHRQMAAIPVEAATEAVMSRQLSVQRYSTALLVRLRRIARNEADVDGDDDIEAEE